MSEIHGFRIKELQKAKKKVIETFCIFVPEELTIASGAIQVGLCAGAEAGKEKPKKVLPS